ncbi:MAG: hypothetical protein AAFP90_10875, partial [Planctomycetota bacterium]
AAGMNTLNIAAAPLGAGFPQALNDTNTINYVEGPNSNDPVDPVFAGALTGLITVDGFESLEFANFEVLNIDAGAGADQINLNNPVLPNELTMINVDGGDPTSGGDEVVVAGTAAADMIAVTAISNDGATITGAQQSPVTIVGSEALIIDGLGGNDSLSVSADSFSEVLFTPGSAEDAGTIAVQSGMFGPFQSFLPVQFQDLGGGGDISILDAGGGVPSLDLHLTGTANDDNFSLDDTGVLQITRPSLFFVTLPIQTTGVSRLFLDGLAGEDAFTIAGNHPIPGSISVAGGGQNDVLNFDGSGGSVTLDLQNASISETAPVGYSGIERVDISTNSDLNVFGSDLDESLNVTPTDLPGEGSFTHNRSLGIVFDYSATNPITFGTLGGNDTVNVFGDISDNNIVVSGQVVSVDLNEVTLGNDVESVSVHGLHGDDTIDLTTATITGLAVHGGAGDDNLFGTTRNADSTVNVTAAVPLMLYGGPGNDTLIGASLADMLHGDDGDDVIEGAQGSDRFFGGDGSDYLRWIAGDGSDLMEGGDGGTDQLVFIANNGNNLLQLYGGGTFSNNLAGLFPPQTLNNASRAIFELNNGQVFLNIGDVESVQIDALGGADNIVINNQVDTMSAAGNMISTGTDLGSTTVQSVEVLAGDGNDNIEVHGTAGDDTIDAALQGAAVTVEGLPVLVSVNAPMPADTLFMHGQSGDDTISAAPGLGATIGLVMAGDSGDDILSGDGTMLGDDGDDTFIAGIGNNVAIGGSGDDTYVLNDANQGGMDQFAGGAGNDTVSISGTDFDDSLTIDEVAGAHTIAINAGGPTNLLATSDFELLDVSTGRGDDAVTTSGNVVGLQVALGDGDDTLNAMAQLTPVIAMGGAGNDNLIGSDPVDGDSVSDILYGGPGDDRIEGGRGRDQFFGGDGNDYFVWVAGDGSDLMEGGAGQADQLVFIANDGDTVLQVYGGGVFANDLGGFFPGQTVNNAARAIFELNAGQVFLNTGDVESIEIDALGGVDNIVINNQVDTMSAAGNPISTGTDLAPTALQSVEIFPGLGNDNVEFHGTAGDDDIDAALQGAAITVEGLPVLATINGPEATDTMFIHGQEGDDNLKAAAGL